MNDSTDLKLGTLVRISILKLLAAHILLDLILDSSAIRYTYLTGKVYSFK